MRRFLVLLAALLAACGHAPPPAPAPAPAESERQPLPPPPSLPPPTEIRTCVVRGRELAEVTGIYVETTSDTLVQGRRFAEVFPMTSTFALNASWFRSNEPITYRSHRYVKFGLPRILLPGEVVHDGDFGGVPVFVEPRSGGEVIYLPVEPRCEFQPYRYGGIK